MIFSRSQRKGNDFFQMSEKRGILDDPLLRDMGGGGGGTEKPGTMMGTQPFIRDDHPALFAFLYIHGFKLKKTHYIQQHIVRY